MRWAPAAARGGASPTFPTGTARILAPAGAGGGGAGLPLWPYAFSKVVGERTAEIFGRCYGMALVGLRYFNVYGPRQDPSGDYAAVIPRWFAAIRAGERPVILGDGEQSRDFVY